MDNIIQGLKGRDRTAANVTFNNNSNFQRQMQKQNHNPNQFIPPHPKPTRLLYSHDTSRPRTNLCRNHQQDLGRHFCNQCLCYSICNSCLQAHRDHTVQTFASFEQAKQMTKQTLLLEVEQTLNRLKGRENQLKNQVEEIGLIKQKLKQLSAETIGALRGQLQQLQRKVCQKIESEFQRYEKELDSFYREYNSVNDYLRDNLLRIIDGQINAVEFGKANVCKDIDTRLMPNFGKVKQGMEKCKKYLKNVRVSMGELENSIRFFSSEEEKSQSKFEKYDRYLKERTYNEGEYNSPLLRTLNILESNHMDLTLIRSKLRN